METAPALRVLGLSAYRTSAALCSRPQLRAHHRSQRDTPKEDPTAEPGVLVMVTFISHACHGSAVEVAHRQPGMLNMVNA